VLVSVLIHDSQLESHGRMNENDERERERMRESEKRERKLGFGMILNRSP
jgi:hypothetical protein